MPMQETWEVWLQSLDQEDPLEEGMANHSSILSWRIPWIEEPGELWSMGLQRVRNDWSNLAQVEKHKVFLCMSFVLLEFWNHVCTAVQGLSYITITAGFSARWKLKEYGCKQLKLMHWWNDSGSWSDLFCTKDPRKRGESSSLKRSCSRACN